MENVTVKKTAVLEILRQNREKHHAIFEEAVEGYRKTVEDVLKENLKRIRAGQRFRVHVVLPEPVDHTKDYDRAICMMEMSIDEDIVLAEHDFQAYVMDDWAWKGQFLAGNAAYSSTATTLLGS